MQFQPTQFKGVWLIHLKPARDERGFFARTFCADEFGARGLETAYPQHSISLSSRRGTVRGMHYQRDPHSEVKLVRCLRGTIWDVVVDLRREAPTYRRWQAFELSDLNRCQIYIPKGFAHGFQALSDDTEVSYLISERYTPEASCGIRHDDPSIGIAWPLPVTEISKRDLQWPEFA
jgi:dTDP-4-dehydrorhamnose 3,5-epimerase